MSQDALVACFALWIVFCVLLALCASFEGRTMLWVALASIFLTPLAGILVLIYCGMQRRAVTLRGCPYCIQPVELLATACHHCLRPIPAIYVEDRRKKTPAFIYCFSIVGIIVGTLLTWVSLSNLPPTQDAQTANPPTSLSSFQSPPSAASSTVTASDSTDVLQTVAPNPAPETFGKGWVQLKSGDRIMNIEKVLAAPDRQVTLITPYSGRNVSQDDLPDSFLKEWGIATDSRTTNQP